MGDNISTCGGIISVLWRGSFSIVRDNSRTCGDSFRTVEVVQYSKG